MALEIKYCFPQGCDCKTALFSDTTGVYSVSNPTGYGVATVADTAITSAIISVQPPAFTPPIIFTFTIANLVITDVTRTDQFGTVLNNINCPNFFAYFSLLYPSLAFPLADLEFNTTLLYGTVANFATIVGGGTVDKGLLIDGAYTVEYSVTNGVAIYDYDAFVYWICQSTQCKNDASKGYINGALSQTNLIQINLNYDALLVGVSLGDNTFVTNQIETLQDLCRACGCGCGC